MRHRKRRRSEMEMLELNDLNKTFNPGTVNEKVALNGHPLQRHHRRFHCG